MPSIYSDTDPEVEKVLIDLLRQAPPWRKVEMVSQMNATVRALVLIGLRKRNPEDSPAKIQRRLADLLLGSELAKKVYGPLENE
jgi:hypothetical protein